MRVTIRIPRPAGCPCCASEESADAMRLKAFIEQIKSLLGEETKIEIVFDSSKDTPKIAIDGRIISNGRYPDAEELGDFCRN